MTFLRFAFFPPLLLPGMDCAPVWECVCVCVRACVRACVYVCVCGCFIFGLAAQIFPYNHPDSLIEPCCVLKILH